MVQGVLKNKKNSRNGLKTEIYDFHQYTYSPKTIFHCELEASGSLLSQYMDILIQIVFSPYRVS